MKEKILGCIRRLPILNKNLLLAISGGPDSMALLHGMLAVKGEMNLRLFVAHVNHGLRPTAKEEAAFVADMAARHHLPFFLLEEDMAALAQREKISVESAGRLARYRFLGDLAKKTQSRIVTGHHKNDQVETVLLHILRGAGMRGLAGMRAEGRILRPLLPITKSEILAYLEEEEIPWVLDESNLETEYFRNRIRHELLPLLRKLQPGVEETLLHLAENARDAQEMVDDAVADFLQEARVGEDEIVIAAPAFFAQKSSAQRAIIRGIVLSLKGNEIDLSRAQTEEIRRVWQRPSGKGTRLAELSFLVTQNGLVAKREKADTLCPMPVPEAGEMSLPGGILRIYEAVPSADDLLNPDILYLPREETQGLVLRGRAPGDRFRSFGSGGEKSLAKAMKDLKIRHDLRDGWPLLCRGNRVLWIIGRQKSEETRHAAEKPARAFEYIRRG